MNKLCQCPDAKVIFKYKLPSGETEESLPVSCSWEEYNRNRGAIWISTRKEECKCPPKN